jgi:hypothetical protein
MTTFRQGNWYYATLPTATFRAPTRLQVWRMAASYALRGSKEVR